MEESITLPVREQDLLVRLLDAWQGERRFGEVAKIVQRFWARDKNWSAVLPALIQLDQTWDELTPRVTLQPLSHIVASTDPIYRGMTRVLMNRKWTGPMAALIYVMDEMPMGPQARGFVAQLQSLTARGEMPHSLAASDAATDVRTERMRTEVRSAHALPTPPSETSEGEGNLPDRFPPWGGAPLDHTIPDHAMGFVMCATLTSPHTVVLTPWESGEDVVLNHGSRLTCISVVRESPMSRVITTTDTSGRVYKYMYKVSRAAGTVYFHPLTTRSVEALSRGERLERVIAYGDGKWCLFLSIDPRDRKSVV